MRKFLPALLLSAFLTVPAVWAAPTLTTDRPCYVYTMPVKFKASEMPPGAQVTIYSAFFEDGSPEPGPSERSYQGVLNADGAGVVEGQMPGPNSGNEGKSGTLILEIWPNNNDRTGAVVNRLRIVPVSIKPELIGYEDTNGSLNLVVTGFMNLQNLYAHYILQQPGKPDRELKTVKVGALDPVTGGLKLKYKKFPFSPIPKGGYLIQFDGYEKYASLTDHPSTPDKPYVLFNTSVVK